MKLTTFFLGLTSFCIASAPGYGQEIPKPAEGDFVTHNFHFHSGETLPELNLHYATYGKPVTDAAGRVTNAVLILHGTTGTGQQFVRPSFAGVLFGPGQLLDTNRYFVILPDSIGHGHSSKPSDGMHMHFPHYDYDDMVEAQHLLLTEGLKVNHLRLVLGTSMGCMHSWVWTETYPDFMDAVMPLACLPVQIAGRNRISRKMIIDSIKSDPAWMNGEYKEPPPLGMRGAINVFMFLVSAPLEWQKEFPTRDQADAFEQQFVATEMKSLEPNDTIYAFDASRNYDPSPKLDQIQAHVMFINSADDQINPPELGIAEREIKKVKHGKFVLLPITDQTRGHGTHTLAAVWKQYLEELLKESER
ncbi:MAG TPA: alpha/beta fold hydrolase [Candidatus Sulfotelmatobacter sp.]|nr:alpha/beta fold hydrolase [Candidatus Sulfotelmatobacter sp.]